MQPVGLARDAIKFGMQRFIRRRAASQRDALLPVQEMSVPVVIDVSFRSNWVCRGMKHLPQLSQIYLWTGAYHLCGLPLRTTEIQRIPAAWRRARRCRI